MTLSVVNDDAAVRRNALPLTIKLAVAFALIVASDLLLWERDFGINVAIVLALSMSAAWAFAARNPRSLHVWPYALPVIAMAPLVENVSTLSALTALSGTIAFVLAISGRLRTGIARSARQIFGFAIALPFSFIPDMARAVYVGRRTKGRNGSAIGVAWIMPIALGVVFILLFGAANPIIETWLAKLDFWLLLDLVSPARSAMWLLVLMTTWSLLRPRILWFQRARQTPLLIGPVRPVAPVKRGGDDLFGTAAVLRALIVFNVLFAVQTALDVAYLWGGVALPDGMTYATYAHRGAYPLVATALLAASFVLIAARKNGPSEHNSWIRSLIYLWTGQNIVLVMSSILRLDLYVGVYSLTYWRVAAFIWMALVACGLALIIARIATGRSNEWLLSANLAVAAVTLYVCCFINFAAVISGYNVDHHPGAAGGTTVEAAPLDAWYLGELGAGALPAIDRVLSARTTALDDGCLRALRDNLAAANRARMQDWRAWSFRGWRLSQYLDQHAATISVHGSDGYRER